MQRHSCEATGWGLAFLGTFWPQATTMATLPHLVTPSPNPLIDFLRIQHTIPDTTIGIWTITER